MTTMTGGQWAACALVVPPEARIDIGLLDRLGGFACLGRGGFGSEVAATVYAAGDDLLVEAAIPELAIKALLFRADRAEQVAAFRGAIVARFAVCTEQILRDVLYQTLPRSPWTLVAMAMALGGGPAERQTRDLLRACRDHDDAEVRAAALYADTVAEELRHLPVIWLKADPHKPARVLGADQPMLDGRDRISVRSPIMEHVMPGCVTWLRLVPGSGCADDVALWAEDAQWDLELIHDDADSAWSQYIYCDPVSRSALHILRHPALEHEYVAVHGASSEPTVGALRTALDAEVLIGPPAGWGRTAD
ncbi:hypothetical protein ACU635_60185 [[Actinomadura] parvosata]|uniref:hypothetical protein n=1 Tax=[Actinomadura] parvosata TaxID=1955412 RepID=UPI00406C61BD